MKGIAVVIVTYNSGDVISACLDGCLPWASEVIVVDNASTDNTVETVGHYPAVRLIANQQNRGFAGAVNQGFAATRQPLVLLLNPDAVLTTGLDALSLACAQKFVWAASGRLVDAEGHFQQGFAVRRFPTATRLAFEVLGINRIWPSNPVNRRYRYLDRNPNEAGLVEQPAGAFLMIRHYAWERLGGFDERFHPLWFEDVDFCNRLWDEGYRIRYEPAACARHLGGHSANRLDWGTREVYWYGSLLKYAGKYFSRHAVAGVVLAIIGGVCLRLVVKVLRSGSLESVPIYGKVIRLACRHLVQPAGPSQKNSSSRRTFNNQARIHGL